MEEALGAQLHQAMEEAWVLSSLLIVEEARTMSPLQAMEEE
jgi:hypothetical protein